MLFFPFYPDEIDTRLIVYVTVSKRSGLAGERQDTLSFAYSFFPVHDCLKTSRLPVEMVSGYECVGGNFLDLVGGLRISIHKRIRRTSLEDEDAGRIEDGHLRIPEC